MFGNLIYPLFPSNLHVLVASYWQHGSVYKLAFGPKAFVVVSDPVVARHVLRENAFSYDKVLNDFYFCIVQVIFIIVV